MKVPLPVDDAGKMPRVPAAPPVLQAESRSYRHRETPVASPQLLRRRENAASPASAIPTSARVAGSGIGAAKSEDGL